MQREYRVVARVVGVVNRRPVNRLAVFAHREMVGDGDRFAVRDQESMVRAFQRRPAAHARGRAGPVEVNRGIAAVTVAFGARRPLFLMRAPAQFRRLQPFGNKAIDRPCVDEFAALLAAPRHLRVALGNVDDPDAQPPRQVGPVLMAGWPGELKPGIDGQVPQSLFHEGRRKARVGPLRHDGRGPVPFVHAKGQHLFTQGVVGAPGQRRTGIGITAGPGLNAGVEVHHTAAPAKHHQGQTGHIDGQVQQEVSFRQVPVEHGFEISLVERLHHKIGTEFLAMPLLSALREMTVTRPAAISIWRSTSGSAALPMLPKPSMTSRPLNGACLACIAASGVRDCFAGLIGVIWRRRSPRESQDRRQRYRQGHLPAGVGGALPGYGRDPAAVSSYRLDAAWVRSIPSSTPFTW
jgi:hypothetical protein